jgi:rare lipoprotein A
VAAADWRLAVSCAALGLTSLAAACAPIAHEPLASTAAPPGDEQMERTTAPPSEAARPDGLASAPEQPWLRPLGEQQLGKASYYGPEFTGRKMANGRRFDPRSTSVAHRTLPFGTRVLVTHLGNGRSAMATVEDRGPFVAGRIIDLSPRLAEHLGMIAQGVAPVEVTPVEVTSAEAARVELAEARD